MDRITRANAADAAELLALQLRAYQSEAVLYDDWSIPPLTQTLAGIEREFAEKTFLKLCDDKNRIIGSVRGALRDGTCEVGRLMVHPDFQRRGIGARLLAALEMEFPDANRFELFTGSRSTANIRLYERLGYCIFRTERLSSQVELVFMEKG